MVTITRASTGRTTYAGESFSEFKARQRAKNIARRRGDEALAQALQRARGTKQVESLTKIGSLQVKQPEIVEIVNREKTDKGEIIRGYTKADIVKREALRNAQSRLQSKKIVEELPSGQFISGATRGEFKTKEKVRGFIEPVKLTKLEISRRKLIGIQQKQTGSEIKSPIKPLKAQVGLAGLGVARGVKGVFDVAKNPKKFVKEQVEFGKAFVKNPKETTKQITSIFKEDPVGFVAEFYAFNKAFGVAGKGVQKSPVGRALQEELFIRRQPKELQKSVRAIIKSSKVQEKINPYNIKKAKVNFAEATELNKLEARTLKKTLTNDPNSFVFGSVASRSLSGGKTKIPKDVDIATKDINIFNKRFFDNLPKNQRGNYKVKGQKIIRVSDNTAILDVKPASRLIPEKSLITKRGTLPITGEKITFFEEGSFLPIPKKRLVTEAFTPTQKIEKVGGIRLVGFGEQTTRKGLGTLQVLLEKNVKRAKDPASFVESLEIQVANLKKSKPKTKLGELNKNRKIKKLEAGLDILKSDEFIKLLNKKVPNLSKDYPILTKIDAKKLKEHNKFRDRQTIDKFLDEEFTFKVIGGKENVIKKPKLEKPSIIPSRIPSKVPSITPISSILKPFKASEIKSSKTPSQIKKSVINPSKTPSKPSIIPKSTIKLSISKIPSKIPSQIKTSQLRQFNISKLPKGKTKLIPKAKSILKIKKDITSKQTKKYKKTKKLQLVNFTPTLIRPKGKLNLGKKKELPYYTGLELR